MLARRGSLSLCGSRIAKGRCVSWVEAVEISRSNLIWMFLGILPCFTAVYSKIIIIYSVVWWGLPLCSYTFRTECFVFCFVDVL